MQINKIILENFRNYQNAEAFFSEGVNIITGINAQGKTNLIEAIYYLSSGRTFRPGNDRDMINLNSTAASINAEIFSFDREQSIKACLYRTKRRELYTNGVKLKKASELLGRLSAVLFGPDDLDMVKGGAAVRRRLMDTCISQLRPRYLSILSEYNRLHEHKTRILRNYHTKPGLLDLLDDYNYRMAQYSAHLIFYRASFTELLSKKASLIHSEFSGGSETMEVKYKTVGDIDAKNKKPNELLPYIQEHQSNHRQAELKSRLCLTGAHKDDLEIMIDGLPARKYASQGQARTAAVSIKLSEREIHFDDKCEYPVLLLDDVLSELDNKRQKFILERIPHGQVFITCCDESQISTKGKTIKVKNGSFE